MAQNKKSFVLYADLIKSPTATIELIYGKLNMSLSNAFKLKLAAEELKNKTGIDFAALLTKYKKNPSEHIFASNNQASQSLAAGSNQNDQQNQLDLYTICNGCRCST